MGSIDRIGTGWKARYRTAAGRSRSKTFTRKSDAERFLVSVEHSKATGGFVDPSLGRRTFREYAESWLATKANLAPQTRINVEGRLRNHLLPRFGNVSIVRIEPADVRSWVATLSASGLAPGTVRAVYLVLAQIMATAEVDRIIARSPCLGVQLPSERGRGEMQFLNAGQVGELAEVIGPRYRALIYTAAYTGLRAGELAALKVERINRRRGTLDVVESLGEVRGKFVTGPTKTRARRTVTMPRFLTDMLAEHISAYPSPDGYVFTSARGGPVRHHNFYLRQFRPAVRRAGLPDGLRFHDLRHTAASLLISRGANPKQIQERLGHSTIQLTFDRYGHLFEGHDAALLDTLDAAYAETRVSDPCPVKPRYPCSGLAPVVVLQVARGSGGVDAVGSAAGVREGAVFS